MGKTTSAHQLTGRLDDLGNKVNVAEHSVPYLTIAGVRLDSFQHISLNLYYNIVGFFVCV